jgi:DNA-binding transcriptional LysR family regulator
MDALAAMRCFVAVVEAGSFSAAARRLDVGQPAVSKTVAALEQRLGVKLLLRTSRAQQVTDAGRRYYDRARNVLDEADAAESAARDEASSLVGRLRISAAPVYASTRIVPRLGEFLAAHPELEVELILDDRRIDLVEEGIDLAIRAGDLEDSTLTARRIDRSRRRVVAAPAYLQRRGRPAHPNELPQHELVSYAGFAPAAWTFVRDGAVVRVAVRSRLKVSAAEALVAAARAGLGCALVSERMVARELASGELVTVLDEWDAGGADVWVIFPGGRRPTARARAFVDWLESGLRAAAEAPRATPG